MTDPEALRRFAADGSPDALARVVDRHVHVVYSSAFRQLRDTTLARQATRAAFLLLARRANALRPATPLAPWLFDAAHQVCRAIRGRTPGAADPGGRAPAPSYSAPSVWAVLSPLIDDAIASLPADARDAVLLKYVAGLPLRDVAGALGVADDVAGQRINAGVGRLRRFLAARNVSVPADALVAAMQAHGVREAPGQVAREALAAALAPPGQGGEVESLAAGVAAGDRRTRTTHRVLTAVALLLAGALVLRVATIVRNARAVAATQPATAPVVSPADGSFPSPTPPPPSLPAQPLPATKPIKAVDPVLAARFLDAVRASNFAAVENYASVDEAVVNVKDPTTGRSAVEVAAELVSWQRRESAKVAHFLIEGGAQTDIHTAARAGHAGYVAIVLQLAPRMLEAPDARGLTPLQRAALIPGSSPECEAVVDLLISLGAKVDLATACTFGRFDDAKALLAEDPARVNRPVLGGTPLHWAARPRRHGSDPLAVATLLLDAGADVRARDAAQDGMTPLHHAAEWGAPAPLAELFLAKGADVNALDDYGWTPLDYATDRNHKELAALLADKGGRLTITRYGNQPGKTLRFFTAVRNDDAKLVQVLLNDTPELAQTRGSTGETPLHWAAAQGNVAVIDLLLADKADMNAQEANRFGGTPLHWAVRHGQAAAARHLMEKRADPKAVNARTGQTVLHVAARHGAEVGLVDLIVSLGVDKAAKDRFGKTARAYAEESGRNELAGKL